MLEQLKALLRDQFGLHPWAVLAAGGCIAHIVLNAVLRKPITSSWGLLGPLGLGVVLESYEIWLHYKDIGLFAPDNDTLPSILGRHGVDIVLMLAGPLVIVLVGAITAK